MIGNNKPPVSRLRYKNRNLTFSVAIAGLALCNGASAMTIDTGNRDIRMSWANTLKYSAAWRVEDQDASVADNSIGVQANTNDGDLNFDKGLISNRLDVLSELNFTYKRKYGFRLSGAAWYDSVYNTSHDNPGALGGALYNPRSADTDEFTEDTEELHGRDAELLDAFVFGNFHLGRQSINAKAGRFTQLYGESLFFGSNGVAAAQTSLDLVKALSVPNSRFQEILRPVNQISAQLQLNQNLSFGAYYQLEWRETRLPASGSYFSFADFIDDGGETIILGPGQSVFRGDDQDASDNGQFGAQVKFKAGEYDFGLYAAQYHDKMPQFYVRPGVNVQPGSIGDYLLTYAEDIKMVGASASTLIGDMNVSAEVSFRDDMPLVASGNTVILPGNTAADNEDNAAYPVGRTFHANLSAVNVFNEGLFWDGATLLAEVAFNRRLSISENGDQLDPSATRDATAMQFLFTPEYFQVAPGLDLKTPIGASYGVDGRSSVNGALFPSERGGNLSLGVTADYQRTWQAGLNYTHYYGSSGSIIKYDTAAPELSYKNFHGDRDFISLTVQRTF
ncbi:MULTISPECIES: DUF1302 domain-containing protein [Marinobacter]|uniref:DUF1302 domain-containing protein n=1 Tax=Marinobacter TaxID=2742 RepID=UPI001243FA49|nr:MULTISPECIES: DUF1302 domain-containing protein [Marinobacter]MBL3556349.1 DUF1302 domain-containing protein [Marinobacter sp. JB05H06]